MAGLSNPFALVASVAPALPSHTPFSPGAGPRLTRPSARRGVGPEGGRFLPRRVMGLAAFKRPELRLVLGSGPCCSCAEVGTASSKTPAAPVAMQTLINLCMD